jgi:hypothetical protein
VSTLRKETKRILFKKKITLGAPSNPQNTTISETYAPYEPSPRIFSYEPYRYCEMVNVKPPRCMLGLDFTKTYDEHEESFKQKEHKDQVIENDSYESDQEFEMNRKGFEIPRCMLGIDFSKIHNKHIGNLDTMEDEVDNPSPQSTPQVLPSFEAHTPPVTYPEEVEETLGIPMEVEPLDQAPLDDIGLNTCSDNLTPSSREFPSVDEPEPQSLHTFPSLDIFLGDKRGTDPPINQYYPGSFRMKEVIHSPSSPHVAYSHPKGVYRYFHPHLILSVGKTSPISVK